MIILFFYQRNQSFVRTVRLIIHGKVQGVWFRKSTIEKANELGVKGTVKNLTDGEVEVWASGNQASLKELIDWCKKGPDLAKVKKVVVVEEDFLDFSEFKIVY